MGKTRGGKTLRACAAVALVLAACSDAPQRKSDIAAATITYRYSGDLYGSGLDDVKQQAADYCQRKYKNQPYLAHVTQDQGFNRAIFECR